MEKVMVDWEELNNLLFFLEKNVKVEERFQAQFIIQNFLDSVNRDHYYGGIDLYSLADWSLCFMEEYRPAILQVEADGNDAVLTIYHGDEETYGDSESLELYRLPFATRTEFDLLKTTKKENRNITLYIRKILFKQEREDNIADR